MLWAVWHSRPLVPAAVPVVMKDVPATEGTRVFMHPRMVLHSPANCNPQVPTSLKKVMKGL